MATAVDIALLMHNLLSERFPDVTWVTGGPGVDAAQHLPLGVVTPQAGSRVPNGAPALGQTWQVAVSVIDPSQSTTTRLAMDVHDAMHDFHATGATIPGVGWISYVDDVSMFSPSAQDYISADDLHQQNAVYTVIVRK